jgi:hypothetical protein
MPMCNKHELFASYIDFFFQINDHRGLRAFGLCMYTRITSHGLGSSNSSPTLTIHVHVLRSFTKLKEFLISFIPRKKRKPPFFNVSVLHVVHVPHATSNPSANYEQPDNLLRTTTAFIWYPCSSDFFNIRVLGRENLLAQ